MEERIRDLEKEITDLKVGNASLGQAVEHLSVNVKDLATVVQDLRDTMNKSKGALWAITGGAGIVGATAASIIHQFFGK